MSKPITPKFFPRLDSLFLQILKHAEGNHIVASQNGIRIGMFFNQLLGHMVSAFDIVIAISRAWIYQIR